MRSVGAGFGLMTALALAGLVVAGPVGPAAVQAQDARSPEAEAMWVEAGPLIYRLKALRLGPVATALERKANGWDGLEFAEKQQADRWFDMLAPLTNTQLSEVCEPVKAEPDPAKVAAFLDQLALEGGRRPATAPARVVILAIGGGEGTFARLMAGEMADTKKPTSQLLPRFVTDIRPWGALCTNFNSKIPDGRGFLGFLLTGRSNPGFVKKGSLIFLGAPMLGELYRRWEGNEAAPAHKTWVLYRDADVRLEHCEAKGFRNGERKQVAVWGTELHNVTKSILRTEVIDARSEGASPFDLERRVAGLTASKLRVDRLIDDVAARNFVADGVARAKLATPDSDAFLARTAARLLHHPMDPRIVVVRLGRPALPPGVERWTNDLKRAATQDIDRLAGIVWDAARSSARWRHRTYFWLILENSKLAFVAGPDVAPGTVTKVRAGLKQVVPTVVKMLGYDPEEFLDDMGKVNRKPIDELFIGG